MQRFHMVTEITWPFLRVDVHCEVEAESRNAQTVPGSKYSQAVDLLRGHLRTATRLKWAEEKQVLKQDTAKQEKRRQHVSNFPQFPKIKNLKIIIMVFKTKCYLL